MRAKRARALRRQAQEQTVGQPARELRINKWTYMVWNGPATTRAVYRKLKRESQA